VAILVAALSMFLGLKWARLAGATLAALYAFAIGYVVTTQLRGLTPPPGQAREPIDLGLAALAISFGAASVFIAIGRSPVKEC
jgi:hypothetical protein